MCYAGKTYTLPSQLQIDHLIPVSEAWGSGAHLWTQSRRIAFYNDLGVGYVPELHDGGPAMVAKGQLRAITVAIGT